MTTALIIVAIVVIAIPYGNHIAKTTRKDHTHTKIGDYIIQSETAKAYLISCIDWSYKNVWVAKSEMNRLNGTISTWLYKKIMRENK